jgi:hypothetical protein
VRPRVPLLEKEEEDKEGATTRGTIAVGGCRGGRSTSRPFSPEAASPALAVAAHLRRDKCMTTEGTRALYTKNKRSLLALLEWTAV